MVTHIYNNKRRTFEFDQYISGETPFDIAHGMIQDSFTLNKFGRAGDVDTVSTDIWSRANATDAQPIWLAPTAARAHTIVSTSVSDVLVGAGARTIQIYGLTAWDTAEVSEVIDLNGTTGVVTANSYVIVHRMKVLTSGASGPNVGQITATAAVDATVTAQVEVGIGQTEMAIYGVPSINVLYLMGYYGNAIRASTNLSIEFRLLVNQFPEDQPTVFINKHSNGIQTDGLTAIQHGFLVPYKIEGPAIVKLQGISTANNSVVSAGFDGILELA